jgi:hypothetical protein
VTAYRVILAIRWRGATVGSTDDEVEASTPEEAEAKVIEAWRAVQPDCTFRALLILAA